MRIPFELALAPAWWVDRSNGARARFHVRDRDEQLRVRAAVGGRASSSGWTSGFDKRRSGVGPPVGWRLPAALWSRSFPDAGCLSRHGNPSRGAVCARGWCGLPGPSPHRFLRPSGSTATESTPGVPGGSWACVRPLWYGDRRCCCACVRPRACRHLYRGGRVTSFQLLAGQLVGNAVIMTLHLHVVIDGGTDRLPISQN